MHFNDDWDRKFDKQFDKTFKLVGFLSVLWTLIYLAAIGGIIYVAIHFITKYW